MKIFDLLNETQLMLIKNPVAVENWLHKNNASVDELKITDDGVINAKEIIIANTPLGKFPVQFGQVISFKINKTNLTSLHGSPSKVTHFNCNTNKLTNLIGGPSQVDGQYACRQNSLTSLEGAPTSVGKDFNCSYNQLTSLEHVPRQVDSIMCIENPIAHFRNIHKMITVKGGAEIPGTPVPGIICWILVPGIQFIDLDDQGTEKLTPVQNILNKHIRTKDILACQEELIDAGFGAWAKA